MIYHDGSSDFHGLERVVRQTTADLREIRDEFDAIIVTGVSGLVVGSPVALRLRKPLLVLRKPSTEEESHGYGNELLNWAAVRGTERRVVFLDDFISMGDTFHRCVDAVENIRTKGQLVAEYTYKHGKLRRREDADFGKWSA